MSEGMHSWELDERELEAFKLWQLIQGTISAVIRLKFYLR